LIFLFFTASQTPQESSMGSITNQAGGSSKG